MIPEYVVDIIVGWYIEFEFRRERDKRINEYNIKRIFEDERINEKGDNIKTIFKDERILDYVTIWVYKVRYGTIIKFRYRYENNKLFSFIHK